MSNNQEQRNKNPGSSQYNRNPNKKPAQSPPPPAMPKKSGNSPEGKAL